MRNEFDGSEVKLQMLLTNIHKTAEEKGFWKTMDNVLMKMEHSEGGKYKVPFTEEEIVQVKKAFVMQKLMMVVSEAGEACNADRSSIYANWDDYEGLYEELKRKNHRQEFCFVTAFEGYIKDTLEDEIADTIIRMFDLCEKLGIPIIKHIVYKMEFNKTRDKMHGKEY